MVSNNKVGFKDLTSNKDLKDLAFKGTEAINFNIDSEIAGPSVAVKLLGFAFAISSKAYIKANLINVDPTLADAISNGGVNSIAFFSQIQNNGNQRINATVWGELGFSAAHKLYKSENHQLNGGATLKLLFPGAYANIGAGNFNGTVTNNTLGDLNLINTNANVNISYSGNLANDFTNANDYTKSLYGPLSGMSGDVGVDYQYKPDGKNYKLKIGAAIKNFGSMTFKSSNNYSKDYKLSIQGTQSLNLNQFENAQSITNIESVLITENANGNINFTATTSQKDFKVKLPTVMNLYADLRIVSKLNVTVFMVQKMNKNEENDQIFSQNSISLIPRINIGPFEAFIPLASNEISGTTGGFGFRLGGFFMGSNSVITALTSNSKQADFYTGFRFGFL